MLCGVSDSTIDLDWWEKPETPIFRINKKATNNKATWLKLPYIHPVQSSLQPRLQNQITEGAS